MKVCVVGVGGIGGTIAARLAASGHEVRLIARGANLRALQADGLEFVDHVGPHSGRYRLPAGNDPAGYGVQDCVVLAMKAHQLPAALPNLSDLLGPNTVVVPAINGLPWWYFQTSADRWQGLQLRALDPAGTMAQQVPARAIVGCVVHLAAELRAPGQVHCTAGRRLILGEPDGAQSERLRALVAAWQATGFALESSSSIRRDIWVKLIGNCSFNPVAALTGYRMDQICADEEVLSLIRAMLVEGAAVAAAVGIEVGISPEQRIGIARELGGARISMLQDLEKGRSLEIAPIVGAVIELAAQVHVAVPTIRALYALLQARARALNLPTD